MGPRTGYAEYSERALRRAQWQAAERAILKTQVLQGLSARREAVISFPVCNNQRLLLLMHPPEWRPLDRHTRRENLPRSDRLPQHIAAALFEDDDIQEIKVEQRTENGGDIS